jgi:hypothetical protein
MTDPRTWPDIANNCRIVFMESTQVALYFLILAGVTFSTIGIIAAFAVLVEKILGRLSPIEKDGEK